MECYTVVKKKELDLYADMAQFQEIVEITKYIHICE